MSLAFGRSSPFLLEHVQVHMPAGAPVRIEVGVRDGMAVLAVIDTGPAIDPEQAAQVFDRFYRGTPPGSSGTAPVTGGSGLGLAIVRTMSEPQGSGATVISRPREAARFE